MRLNVGFVVVVGLGEEFLIQVGIRDGIGISWVDREMERRILKVR